MNTSAKLAVVTGGTSGIGLETASLLHGSGFDVILLGRDPAKATPALARLGDRASFCRCDVSSVDDVDRAVRVIGERGKRIDVLINCAGVLQRNALTASSGSALAAVKAQIDTILWGTIHTTTQFADLLAAGRDPIIVNVGSVAGREVFRTLTAYGSAKAGVSFFTKASAQELYSRGIRVVCVAPGVVDTPLMPAHELAMLRASLPRKRLQQPQEIARLIAALVSGDFPSLTGTTIDIHDGAGLFDVGGGSPPAPQPTAKASAPAEPADDTLDGPLKAVLRELFGVAPDQVNDATGPEDIVKWDSLGHYRLVAALERQFGCELSVDDSMELTSVLAIKQVLRRHRG